MTAQIVHVLEGGCIYGPALQNPENLAAFMRAAGLPPVAPIVEGIQAEQLGRE
jgi:hypothetical protein